MKLFSPRRHDRSFSALARRPRIRRPASNGVSRVIQRAGGDEHHLCLPAIAPLRRNACGAIEGGRLFPRQRSASLCGARSSKKGDWSHLSGGTLSSKQFFSWPNIDVVEAKREDWDGDPFYLSKRMARSTARRNRRQSRGRDLGRPPSFVTGARNTGRDAHSNGTQPAGEETAGAFMARIAYRNARTHSMPPSR